MKLLRNLLMSEPVLTMDNVYVSLPLYSKPPNHFATNAVVVNVDKEKDVVTVVTDFGNELKFTITSLAYRYTTAPTYLDGFPTETIEMRLTVQLRNLKEKLEKYKHVKNN